MDNMGMEWETSHGAFHLDMQTIQWIMKNAKVSMYNDNRSYIYNKAFAEYLKPDLFEPKFMPVDIFNKIRLSYLLVN